MSSSARKMQRRMAGNPAYANLQKALQAVEGIKQLQGGLDGIGQLGELLEQTKGLIETQALVQREVTIRLIAALVDKDTGDELTQVRELEAAIRGQVLAENNLEDA